MKTSLMLIVSLVLLFQSCFGMFSDELSFLNEQINEPNKLYDETSFVPLRHQWSTQRRSPAASFYRQVNSKHLLILLHAFNKRFYIALERENTRFTWLISGSHQYMLPNLYHGFALSDSMCSSRDRCSVVGYMLHGQFYGTILYGQSEIIVLKPNNQHARKMDMNNMAFNVRPAKRRVQMWRIKRNQMPESWPFTMFQNEMSRSETKPRQCAIELVTDPSVFRLYRGHLLRLMNEMRVTFELANQMFERIDFDGNGEPDRMRVILTHLSMYIREKDKDNPFTDAPNLSAQQILQQFSKRKQTMCGSIAITARNLNVSGVAWAGGNKWSKGPVGLCSAPVKFESINPDPILRNTALITLRPYNRVLSRVQLANNLVDVLVNMAGATAEENNRPMMVDCALRRESTGRSKPVSQQNSNCTIGFNYESFQGKLNDCFHMIRSQCGNQKLELGEQCDCGSTKLCRYLDPCCNPVTCQYLPNCNAKSGKNFFSFHETDCLEFQFVFFGFFVTQS